MKKKKNHASRRKYAFVTLYTAVLLYRFRRYALNIFKIIPYSFYRTQFGTNFVIPKFFAHGFGRVTEVVVITSLLVARLLTPDKAVVRCSNIIVTGLRRLFRSAYYANIVIQRRR